MHAWLGLVVRLSCAPVVSIASIRGRARGAGSEFVLACDPRFASRENALLGQFEGRHGCRSPAVARRHGFPGSSVAAGALEILLVADDFDGPRAELYGYHRRRRPPGRRRRPRDVSRG